MPRKKIEIDKRKDQDSVISVILLCDSPGYRMKSYGPTSLIKINNKYLIDLQIDAIKKTFPNYEIIICIGFDGDKILKHIRNKYNDLNIRLIENQHFNSCNSCECARLCINSTLNDNLLIIDGNLFITKKTLKLINTKTTSTLIEQNNSDNFDIGININENKIAQHFSFGAYKTWSEIIFITGKNNVECIRKFLNHADNRKKFLFEALNELIKYKNEIICIENKFPIFKINNVKVYHDIKEKHEIFNI